MLRLYEIRQPNLPLTANSVFQREYSKEVFPGDPNYGEIEDAGKIDLISYPPPDHPLLPKLDWKPEYGLVRPVIVDIKTSGVDYTDVKGEAAHDAQLRRYAWLSGIYTVGFLWFKKSGHRMVKGSSVTLLDDAEEFNAGDEAVVANVMKDGNIYIVRSDFFVEEMEKAQGRKKNEDGTEGALDTTKDANARKELWLAQNAGSREAGATDSPAPPVELRNGFPGVRGRRGLHRGGPDREYRELLEPEALAG